MRADDAVDAAGVTSRVIATSVLEDLADLVEVDPDEYGNKESSRYLMSGIILALNELNATLGRLVNATLTSSDNIAVASMELRDIADSLADDDDDDDDPDEADPDDGYCPPGTCVTCDQARANPFPGLRVA